MVISYLWLWMNYFVCKNLSSIWVRKMKNRKIEQIWYSTILTNIFLFLPCSIANFVAFISLCVFTGTLILVCTHIYTDLSYNRLAKVPNNSFLSLTNLTFLDLSYNKLVRLEPQSVRRLNNLRTLNISGNIHMDLHEIRETFEVSL